MGQSSSKQYTYEKLLSASSGEAFVYLVKRNDELFVLKIYKPNRHPNHDVLEEIMTKTRGAGSPLVSISSHGLWTDPKTGWTHDFEVMQYCEGGSLAEVNFKGKEEEFKRVALEMAIAIDFCHRHHILHRDVKPGNFLFVDKERKHLVLSDFGIAMMLDDEGNMIYDKHRQLIEEARSVVYAAPEMYMQMQSFSPVVTTKADFYSLGMTLVALWKGEGFLIGKEQELVTMKQENKLPYPTLQEISEHTLSLMMALTRNNVKERAGMAEIEEWAKGKVIFQINPNGRTDFRIPFNVKEGLVANSLQDLAKMMGENPDLAKRYLYQDQIGSWLKEYDMYPEAARLEEITENIYPDNRDSGLYAARLVIDPETPYVGKEGKVVPLSQIGAEIYAHFAEYCEELKDEQHILWIYLHTIVGQDSLPSSPENVQEKPLVYTALLMYRLTPGLPYLLYRLPPELPVLENPNDEKVIEINSLDELLSKVNDLTTEEAKGLLEPDFMAWLSERDLAKFMMVKSKLSEYENVKDSVKGWLMLYTIAFDCGFDFKKVNEGSELVTPSDFAELLVKKYDNQDVLLVCNYEGRLISHIDEVRLDAYFYSRPKYAKYPSYISECLDLKSASNSKRYGPYNEELARMKAVTGISGKVPAITVAKVKFSSLNDIDSHFMDVFNMSEKEQNRLADWVALFFQEDPFTDYKKRSYFDLTWDYYKYISSKLTSSKYYKQGLLADAKVNGAKERMERQWDKLEPLKKITKNFCILPLVVISIAFAVLSLYAGKSFFDEIMVDVGEGVGIIAAIIVGIIGLCLASWPGGLIGALLGYFIISWFCRKFGFLFPWVMVAYCWYLAYQAYHMVKNEFVKDVDPDDAKLIDAGKRVIMGEAFDSKKKLLGDSEDYPVSVYCESANVAESSRPKLYKKAMVLFALALGSLLLCFVIGSKAVEKHSHDKYVAEMEAKAEAENAESLQDTPYNEAEDNVNAEKEEASTSGEEMFLQRMCGTYEFQNDGKYTLVVDITDDRKTVLADLTIESDETTSYKLQAEVNPDDKEHYTFYVLDKNGAKMDNDYYEMKFYEPKESNMTIEYNHKKDGVETDSGILAKVKDPQGNSVE